MADFFSDSDGEKAVEEILAQAMDSTVLDQVAAINCAGFSDSGLPSQLEARFHRLKSFPSSAPLSTKKSSNLSHPPNDPKIKDPCEEEKGGEKNVPTTCSKKCPEEKDYLSDNNDSSFMSLKENPRRKREEKGSTRRRRRKSPSSCSSSSSEGFSSRSVSPPVKTGCFLCSPKKGSKKKNKENRGLSNLGLGWGKNDGKLLSDLSNFSVSSQRRMMRKAMEEEEKICEEAEKIVKWAKQASARMDVSGIEDELSDDENVKFH